MKFDKGGSVVKFAQTLSQKFYSLLEKYWNNKYFKDAMASLRIANTLI